MYCPLNTLHLIIIFPLVLVDMIWKGILHLFTIYFIFKVFNVILPKHLTELSYGFMAEHIYLPPSKLLCGNHVA